MDDNRTISQSIFGHDARIIQGDVIGGSVSVTNNYGTSSQGTDKRDGEDDILCRLYTSPYEDRKDRNPPRVPGTCEWFTSHELFKEWERSDSSRLLWVSADPGCGKSVLVRHLVESVLQTTESRTVCYFFFKDDFPDQKTVVNALRCILRQLFIQKPLLFSDKVLRRFITGGETFLNSFTELWKTLIQISKDQGAGEIICILDAIDECDDQGSQLAQELCKLYGAANDFHLKFLLTSRPYGNIHRGFRPLEIPGLPVIHLSGESEDEVRKISQEIDIFIRFKVKDIAKRLKLLEEEQNLLLQELMKISHRTYLWVYLTLDLIERDIVVDKTISTAASCIPETVDEAYDRILSKSCDFEQAKKILHIIVAAVRPLTLKEMNFALLLRKSHHSWEEMDLKPEIRFRQELRDVCGLLIVIIDSKIYLLHQTAKEFLLRDDTHLPAEVHKRLTWKRSLDLLESHHILSNICIWYLLLLEAYAKLFGRVGISYLRDKDKIFLDYSAKYWAIHFREQRMQVQEEKTELILKICDIESRLCQVWFQEYWTSTNTKFPKGFTTLMITAYFGLQTAVQNLLEIDVDLNCQDGTYQRSALSWAARNGFHDIAKLLIRGTHFKLGPIKLPFRKGAEIDLADKYGRTPLSYAVWDGNITMVGLLLNAGAGVHVKDEVGGTPMSYAVWNQNERVIDILLQKGKQVDDDNINDLLFSAAKKGHEEVIELLLKTDRVKPDVKDQEGQTLLLCAVKEGHMAVIRVLLERGANPNHYDKTTYTLLLYAIANRDIAIVKALLEKGADPNDSNYLYQTPLAYAISSGYVEIVTILLEKGANPNNRGYDDLTPLLYAIRLGSVTILKALLENGADLNYADCHRRTPLMSAIEKGHVEIVTILLEKGANPNAKGYDDLTPLLYATRLGSVTILKALLKNGADLNHADCHRQTLLMSAIEKGHVEIVTILLKKGANLNAKGYDDLTPLLYATRLGNVTILKALLENGADPNHADCHRRTPLMSAIEKGHVEIVKTLLEGGADPSRKGRHSQSILLKYCPPGEAPLSYAAQCGHVAIVRILLERGADPNKEDSMFPAALVYAVANRHQTVIKELLEAGANPEALFSRAAGQSLGWEHFSRSEAKIKSNLLWAVEDYKDATKVLLEGLDKANLILLGLWMKELGPEAVAKVLSKRRAKMACEDAITATNTHYYGSCGLATLS